MALADIGAAATNIAVIVALIIFTVAFCIGIFFVLKQKRKYSEFKCIVWERGLNGGIIESIDQAGIFVDSKTKNKRFFMKKARVGLNPDEIPFVQSGKEKIVYLLRVGLKNFYFIKPNVSASNVGFSVGEEDVNWSVNAYEAQKKRFSNSLLMQILPFAGLIFVCIIILILFIYLFKKFDALREMMSMMVEISKNLVQAKTGIIS